MNWTFIPAADAISRALMRFRQDILANDFNISHHANERMVQRGISIDEVVECVEYGQHGASRRVDGLISGCFYYKGLVVFVGAEFGDFNARPNIITVFHDGESYTPYLEDLVLSEPRTVQPPKQDLSIEELEALLTKKRSERNAANARRIEKLRAELASLQKQMVTVQAELDALV